MILWHTQKSKTLFYLFFSQGNLFFYAFTFHVIAHIEYKTTKNNVHSKVTSSKRRRNHWKDTRPPFLPQLRDTLLHVLECFTIAKKIHSTNNCNQQLASKKKIIFLYKIYRDEIFYLLMSPTKLLSLFHKCLRRDEKNLHVLTHRCC